MRRLLCIFLLFCLILGAALPAAAEGEEETPLCANENCILAEDHAGDCVTVPTVEAADAAALSGLLYSKDTLLADLNGRYPRLDTSGDLTVQLPAATYDAPVTCGVDLDGGILTLKGNKTTMKKGLVISAPNICLDDLTFDADDSASSTITVQTTSGLAVSNCTFKDSGFAFKLHQDAYGDICYLSLSKNSFPNKVCNVTLRNAADQLIGIWMVTTSSKPDPAYLILNAYAQNGVDANGKNTLTIQFPQDNSELVANGWKFTFRASCSFKDAFASYDSRQVTGSDAITLPSDKNAFVSLINPNAGEYIIVNDKAPVVTKKDASTLTVAISETQDKYLSEVTVPCSFKAATVTNAKGVKVYSSLDSKGSLTFKVDSAGTYTIKEVKNTTTQTKTVTKYYTISTKDVYPIYHPNFLRAMKTATAEEGVKLNCTEAGKRPISIPVESLEAAAEKGLSVTLDAKSYILQLDAAAMKSLAQQAKGDRVQLKYQSLNHKTLSDEALAAVNSHLAQYPSHSADLAFLVTAVSDSETIVDLQSGTIRLDIPFIVLPGTEDSPNTVYALLSGSAAEKRDTEVQDGRLRATLTDLTEYMVFREGPEPETVPETTEETVEETTVPVETTAETTEVPTEAVTQPTEPEQPEKSNSLMWIPIVLVLLAGGGGAAWFLFLRKRLKK